MKRSTAGLLSLYMVTVVPLFSCATTHQISSGSTNQCMNVVNHGYPVPGTPVHVKQCDPWHNQQRAFNNGTIIGVGAFCLDVQGSAATEGAPQAQQVVDRYHLQKNFAEALEKFFRKQEHVLKKATQRRTGFPVRWHPMQRRS